MIQAISLCVGQEISTGQSVVLLCDLGMKADGLLCVDEHADGW